MSHAYQSNISPMRGSRKDVATSYKAVDDYEMSETKPSPEVTQIGSNSYSYAQHTPNLRVKEIVIVATFVILLPLLLILILLILVFVYQISPSQSLFSYSEVNTSTSIDPNAFYVNLPSTYVVSVASWMSTVMPLLLGSVVALAMYPISDQIIRDSTQGKTNHLPTPFQLAIALKFIGGAIWGGLLEMAMYWTNKSRRPHSQGRVLKSLTKVSVALVIISTSVLAIDTWLHFVTVTVPFDEIVPITSNLPHYSLSLLSPNCTSCGNMFGDLAQANLICTVDPGLAQLQDGLSAAETLNGQSNVLQIYNDGPDSTLAYFGVASSQIDGSIDYTATTFGMRSTCSSISRACGLSGQLNLTETIAYDCGSSAFKGTLFSLAEPSSGYDQQYYNDFSTGNTSETGTLNPFQFAVAFLNQASAKLPSSLRNDPEISTSGDYVAGVLLCNVTAYNVEYDMVQQRVARMVATPSNSSTVNVFTPGMLATAYGQFNIQTALQVASVSATNAQDLANKFALSYSKVVLSIAAGSVVRTSSIEAQRRNILLVARVPKVPLLLLIIIDIIFVCTGLILAILALRSSYNAYQVQLRFNLFGVVAAAFGSRMAIQTVEGSKHLFDEHWEGSESTRIGVKATNSNEFVLQPLED